MQKSLFVGLNTIDMQFLVSRYPEPNSKTKAIGKTIHAGGPATNAAIACAHLGGKVSLLTPIGKHALASFIVEDISGHNVRIVDPIAGTESSPVFASIITTETNGERTVFSYHPEEIPFVSREIDLDCSQYRAALFDGFYPELIVPIAQKCRGLGVTTILDGGSWKPWTDAVLQYIDIAVCSNDFQVPGGSMPSDLFSYLHGCGVSMVAITRGERSIFFSHKHGEGEIDVPEVAAVDTLGAGDIFHGAFTHYIVEGFSFEISLEKAAEVASKSCLTLGTRKWMEQTDAA
jgi:sugar/nucleoside kinase (ribokinase family)